jgi:penicillin-binding protein 1A
MSTLPFSTDSIKKQAHKAAGFERPWFTRLVRLSWIALISLFLCVPLYFYTVEIDLWGLYGGMPSTKALENPENDLSSELISADGVSLGRYFRYNRSQTTYDELSEDLVNTLVISEDHRFYDHSGLDYIAFWRVFWGLVRFSPAGGGSTITQQLAKNLFRTREGELDGHIARLGSLPRLLVRKTKEWIIAIDLERNFTKKEILAMYLNTVEFGSNSYGIKVAAETYFNKSPDSLNLQESAVLIGMLQAITRFNPEKNPDNAFRKRNEVLWKVYRHGFKLKTREQYDSIAALPIELKYKVQNQNEGLATYFRSVARTDLMQWCNENGYDLWESGLKIHTTIDSRLQQFAEESMAEHMAVLQTSFDEHWQGKNPWIDDNGRELPGFLQSRIRQTDTYKNLVARYGEGADSVKIMLNLKKPMRVFSWKGERDTVFSSMDSLNYYKRFLHSGLMAMEPVTGAIRAWVGGINHKYFKYDHVRQGTRQPGSTFKPFVYGTAMEAGYPPCYKLPDVSPSFKVSGTVWYPPNSDGTRGSGEIMTLRQAMARSINSITAQIMQRVGEQNVVDFAHKVGIGSKLDPVPSLCLGTSDVSLYEMVGAYSTFVNNGVYTEPFFVTKIEDKNGNVIANFVPKTREAISEQTAYKMVYMLMGGVEEEGGTSQGLSRDLRIDNEIGGKTGTTNNASDGWYMGLTRDLVTGVWVGGDERSIHFRTWVTGQGGRTARPIWDKFMTKVYAQPELGYVKGPFRRPSRGIDVHLDCDQYKVPGDTVIIEEEEPWDIDGNR